MLKDLGNEMNLYMAEMEKHFQSEEDKEYFKEKTIDLFDKILSNMEEIANYREKEINDIVKKQKTAEKQISELSSAMEQMSKELYGEYDEFEIVCPYCNCQFDVDVDETTKEVICPECNNIIELDWNEDQDED